MKRLSYKILSVFLLITLVSVLDTKDALAVQIHGPPEGFFVHVMGHILFAASLIFILYLLSKDPQKATRPWRLLKYSFWFFLAWNADTLMVHFLHLELPITDFSLPLDIWQHKLLPPLNWIHALYYVGRFDHLLCIPAMLFLVLSLKAFIEEDKN